MANAYVFNDQISSADRTKVEELLKDSGYDPIWSIPADVSPINADTDIGVVCLPAATGDFETINARIEAFVGAGIRVIGIWLGEEKDSATGVPEAIGKYCPTVDPDSSELSGTLSGETDVWEEAGGASSPKPKTKRNKC